jgi:hypothetical protein
MLFSFAELVIIRKEKIGFTNGLDLKTETRFHGLLKENISKLLYSIHKRNGTLNLSNISMLCPEM